MESVVCEKCLKPVLPGEWPFCPHPPATTARIIGDECDIVIRHGACWPDGTPRHYTSKAEINRVAFEQGWTLYGNTPKPNERLEEKRAQIREERLKSY